MYEKSTAVWQVVGFLLLSVYCTVFSKYPAMSRHYDQKTNDRLEEKRHLPLPRVEDGVWGRQLEPWDEPGAAAGSGDEGRVTERPEDRSVALVACLAAGGRKESRRTPGFRDWGEERRPW